MMKDRVRDRENSPHGEGIIAGHVVDSEAKTVTGLVHHHIPTRQATPTHNNEEKL